MQLIKRHKIQIVTTGGTIEKSYDEIEGQLAISESLINKYVLDKLRLPYTELNVIPLMAKDSLYMDQGDREQIYKTLTGLFSSDCPILVVHGTDTMEVTARYCYQQMNTPPVPVVFTGSMRPIGFIDSDGLQNVAEALLACKLMKPGWYLSFHNEVYPVPKVTKIKEASTFGPLDIDS